MDPGSPLIDDPQTRALRSLVQEEMGGIRTILLGAIALAAIAGLVLGAIAVAYITGSLVILSGDVVGPFNRNTLISPYSDVNCTDDEAAFALKANAKGLVTNVTCRVPNATGGGGGGCCNVSTLGGGASGPSDNNTLNIVGTANRVTVTKAASGLVTLSGPQDIGTSSGPTFSAVFATGSGFWYPNPGIGGGLENMNVYKGQMGGSISCNVSNGGVPDPGLALFQITLSGSIAVACVDATFSSDAGPNVMLCSFPVGSAWIPTEETRNPIVFTTGSTVNVGYAIFFPTGGVTIATTSGNFTGSGITLRNACFAYRWREFL